MCVRIVPADSNNGVEQALPASSQHRRSPASFSSRMIIPVEGVAPTSIVDTFSQAREGGVRAHDAIDIMAARGQGVVAALDGPIAKLFWSERGGRTLYQRSLDGKWILYYAHLDSYARNLREGQMLRQGQFIGTVGSTGNADPAAPHLHFAVNAASDRDPWYGGQPINPYPVLMHQ